MSQNKTSQNAMRWTAANVVTMIRVIAIPFWLLFAMNSVTGIDMDTMVNSGPISQSALSVAIFYIALALTDKLDGYLARSRNEVTDFGKFLDPIADKLIVLVALMYLLVVNQISIWIPTIIVAREFLVSGLRMVVASSGKVVAASGLGKAKTATTLVAICGYLIQLSLVPGDISTALYLFSEIVMLVAVVLTIISGIDYFVKAQDIVKG